MVLFFGIIMLVLVLGGGCVLTAYFIVKGDSIIAVLASFFATFILTCAIGGCTFAAYEEEDKTCDKQVEATQQHTHTHCPYCNEVMD
jgi:hypothetical protein